MKPYSTGLKLALCAYSFFRHRHDRVPKYKTTKRKTKAIETVGQYKHYVATSRAYIHAARSVGFRGSFVQQVQQHNEESGDVSAIR